MLQIVVNCCKIVVNCCKIVINCGNFDWNRTWEWALMLGRSRDACAKADRCAPFGSRPRVGSDHRMPTPRHPSSRYNQNYNNLQQFTTILQQFTTICSKIYPKHSAPWACDDRIQLAASCSRMARGGPPSHRRRGGARASVRSHPLLVPSNSGITTILQQFYNNLQQFTAISIQNYNFPPLTRF